MSNYGELHALELSMLHLLALIEGMPEPALLVFVGVALVVAGVVIRKARGTYARMLADKQASIGVTAKEVLPSR